MLHSIDPPEEFVPLTREDPSAFSPPPAFGPFRVLHQIGIGALGPVFRTYEPTRDRLVAVKVFRLDIVPEQAQALAEALNRAIQASLFHPSIVEPIAAGVEGTLAYRAEEYVAAESLDVAMRHYAPAALEKALPFVTQLAGAIDFARAAGVGHGALHPRDIFVTPDEARATGFGVVEALEQVGIRAPVRRPYSAPERIQGMAWSTPADIFSLAAITFELLTARRPSGTGAGIGALPDGPSSAALHAVLARGMDDDPARRFPTALAFVGALEAAGRADAVPATPPGVSPLPAVAAPKTAAPETAVAAPAIVSSANLEARKTPDPLDAPIAAPRLFDREDHDLDVRVRDDADEVGHQDGGPLVDVRDDDGPPERFADEFVAEQAAEAESRRPLEAVHETAGPSAYAAQAPMFGATVAGAEIEMRDDVDRARLRILPVALGVVVGLLIGFGIGHFMGSRGRAPAPLQAESAATPASGPSAAAGGAATSQQPGTYSEQKVTPPAVRSTPAPSATPPPIPDETPAGAAPAPRAPTPVARGRLVVTSTPTRAGVTINGAWRGRTPLTLDRMPFGQYVIRLVLPGYQVARHELTLSARNTTQEVRARLQRTASTRAARPAAPPTTRRPPQAEVFTGSLYVDSRPRGATVFLDGRNIGRTPLSLPEVRIGAHVVRLELAGKQTWTTSTRVVAGETARVTGSLEDRFEDETPQEHEDDARMKTTAPARAGRR